MQPIPVVLIATSDATDAFCTALARSLMRTQKTQPYVSRYFTRVRGMTRTDCAQKKFAFVTVAGSEDEIRLGLDTLLTAANLCPVGILMDDAGYDACVACREFPAHKVRLVATMGEGEFRHVHNHTLRCTGSKVVRVSLSRAESLEAVRVRLEEVAAAPLWGL